jgi:hypothetical protein
LLFIGEVLMKILTDGEKCIRRAVSHQQALLCGGQTIILSCYFTAMLHFPLYTTKFKSLARF